MDALMQFLALVPTVGVTAVIVRALVEWGRSNGLIPDGKASIVQLALNAGAYVTLYVAAQLGYSTQVGEAFAWASANTNVVVAVLGVVVMLATNATATKLLHELVKKVDTAVARYRVYG